MAVRTNFVAGEVLTAEDLDDTFASKLPYEYGTATPTTTDSGFLWYDENDTPPTPKFWDGAAFQALTSGKILQVVRATDGTDRSTSSTALTDANISVTITPQNSASAILLIWSVLTQGGSDQNVIALTITDSSNNSLSGAEDCEEVAARAGGRNIATLIGYATPATTSATTYKGRFSAPVGTANLKNSETTGQLYAIEVSA